MKTGVVQLFGIFIIHFLLALLCGVCFLIVGCSFSTKIPALYKPLIFSLSLVIAEIFRSLVISLLCYGTGTTIDLHFTAGTIGNALAPTPFIEYAYFGGTFALTFILGYLLYIVTSKKHSISYWKHGVGICIILILIHYIIPTYGPREMTTVGVITTNFITTSDEETLLSFAKNNTQVHDMTLSLESAHPDIVVYPEDTRYISYLSNKNVEALSSKFGNTLFIDGDTRVFNGKSTNVSLFYAPGNKNAEARGKSFLLPFSEYIPYLFIHIFTFFISQDELDSYLKNHTYTPINSRKTITFNGLRIGTLLCSEILSYKTIQDVRKEGPSLVFFQSRLNVFHNNPWFRAHLYSFTKVAAAELRRPLISSTNNAPSYIVSPYGKVLTKIPTGFSTSTYVFYKNKIFR
jgi:apolipoprotein N-acyltransferase